MAGAFPVSQCDACRGQGRALARDEGDGNSHVALCWSCLGTGRRPDSLNGYHVQLLDIQRGVEQRAEEMARDAERRLDQMVARAEAEQTIAMLSFGALGPRSTRRLQRVNATANPSLLRDLVGSTRLLGEQLRQLGAASRDFQRAADYAWFRYHPPKPWWISFLSKIIPTRKDRA